MRKKLNVHGIWILIFLVMIFCLISVPLWVFGGPIISSQPDGTGGRVEIANINTFSGTSGVIKDTQTLTGNLTLTADIEVVPPGLIDINGHNLTLTGNFISPAFHQCFSAVSGSVDWTKGSITKIYPGWWGALGNDSSESPDALNKALVSASESNVIWMQVDLAGGFYNMTPVTMQPSIILENGTLRGSLNIGDPTATSITVMNRPKIRNIRFVASSKVAGSYAIQIANARFLGEISNCYFRNWAYCIYTPEVTTVTYSQHCNQLDIHDNDYIDVDYFVYIKAPVDPGGLGFSLQYGWGGLQIYNNKHGVVDISTIYAEGLDGLGFHDNVCRMTGNTREQNIYLKTVKWVDINHNKIWGAGRTGVRIENFDQIEISNNEIGNIGVRYAGAGISLINGGVTQDYHKIIVADETGDYTPTETITGGDSGATAVVWQFASPMLLVYTPTNNFEAGEIITGDAAGYTATLLEQVLHGRSWSIIKGNSIVGTSGYGISLNDVDSITIEGNLIADIRSDSWLEREFFGNPALLAASYEGIYCTNDSSNVKAFNNFLLDSTIDRGNSTTNEFWGNRESYSYSGYTSALDPASIGSGDYTETVISIDGAVVGDYVVSSWNQDLSGVVLTSQATAGYITITFWNHTAGAIDLPSGTLWVRILKK